MKKTVILIILLCILNTGCITEKSDSIKETNSIEEIPIIIPEIIFETPELDKLIQFLEEDKTDETVYYKDQHRGMDYYVCTGYTRALAKNASKYGIEMGAITLRDTPGVGCVTKYYHAMNYVIADDSFIIIEPQSDEIFYLDIIQYHHCGVYRYISIYQNAQMLSNYGKGRETIDIDLKNYNETELVEIWNNK